MLYIVQFLNDKTQFLGIATTPVYAYNICMEYADRLETPISDKEFKRLIADKYTKDYPLGHFHITESPINELI